MSVCVPSRGFFHRLRNKGVQGWSGVGSLFFFFFKALLLLSNLIVKSCVRTSEESRDTVDFHARVKKKTGGAAALLCNLTWTRSYFSPKIKWHHIKKGNITDRRTDRQGRTVGLESSLAVCQGLQRKGSFPCTAIVYFHIKVIETFLWFLQWLSTVITVMSDNHT